MKDRKIVAATLHPASSAAHPNTGKRKGGRLPDAPKLTRRAHGLPRSTVTVLHVDPSTLRRSRAAGRQTSERVLDAATIVARSVRSRRGIAKASAKITRTGDSA